MFSLCSPPPGVRGVNPISISQYFQLLDLCSLGGGGGTHLLNISTGPRSLPGEGVPWPGQVPSQNGGGGGTLVRPGWGTPPSQD